MSGGATQWIDGADQAQLWRKVLAAGIAAVLLVWRVLFQAIRPFLFGTWALIHWARSATQAGGRTGSQALPATTPTPPRGAESQGDPATTPASPDGGTGTVQPGWWTRLKRGVPYGARTREIAELFAFIGWASIPWLLLAVAPALLPALRPTDWSGIAPAWVTGLLAAVVIVWVMAHNAFLTSFQWFWRRTYVEAVDLTRKAVPGPEQSLRDYTKLWGHWVLGEFGLRPEYSAGPPRPDGRPWADGAPGERTNPPPAQFPSRRDYIVRASHVDEVYDRANLLIIVAIIYAFSVVLEFAMWGLQAQISAGEHAGVLWVCAAWILAMGTLIALVLLTLPREETSPPRPNWKGADDYVCGLGITLVVLLGLTALAVAVNYYNYQLYVGPMSVYRFHSTIIFTAAVCVGVLLATVLAFYMFVAAGSPRSQVAFFLALVAALALNGYQTYKLAFPGMDEYYGRDPGVDLNEAVYDHRVQRSYDKAFLEEPELIPQDLRQGPSPLLPTPPYSKSGKPTGRAGGIRTRNIATPVVATSLGKRSSIRS